MAQICNCEICTCTCAARFRRDQIQSIHHAKHYAQYEQKKKEEDTPKAAVAAASHSIIRDFTSTIVSSSADSMLKVLQHNSPTKKLSGTVSPGLYNGPAQYDPSELQLAIERSLGLTGLSLAQNQGMAGNVQLKNELRDAMGGTPSTHLVASNESVSQNRYWRRFRGKGPKCSRNSRNELYDLCSSEEDEKKKNTTTLLRKKKAQIMKKFLKLYKNEEVDSKKQKIKYCMKALDEKNKEVNNEMIDYTFDIYTTELDSFDSMDAALNILEFAEDEEEN